MRPMTPVGLLAALLLGQGCVVPATNVPPVPAERAPAVSDPDDAIDEFVALANRARADAGCPAPLIWEGDLAAIAQMHSEDMRRRGYFDHVTPEGRTPANRVQAAGIPITAVAENIALGQPTGRAVFESWRDSPGHRRNLLNCEYTHHGVGLAGAHWTHVLVRLR